MMPLRCPINLWSGYLSKAVWFLLAALSLQEFVRYGVNNANSTLFVYPHFIGLSDDAINIVFKYFYIVPFTNIIFALLADCRWNTYRASFVLSTCTIVGSGLLLLGTIPPIPDIVVFGSFGLVLHSITLSGLVVCLESLGSVAALNPIAVGSDELEQIYKYVSAVLILNYVAAFLSPITFAYIEGSISTCFGSYYCFPLVFATVLFISMASLGVLYAGKSNYSHYPMNRKGVGFLEMFHCAKHAIKLRSQKTPTSNTGQHFLDHAEIHEKYDPALISEMKQILGVFPLLLAAAVFYSLKNQKAAIWWSQIYFMKPLKSSSYPSTFYVLALEEMFQYFYIIMLLVLHPLMREFRFLIQPWERMASGGFLVGLSYLIAGFVEVYIGESDSKIMIWWLIPQSSIYALGEIFFILGGYALVLTQAPKSKRTIFLAILFLTWTYPGYIVKWLGWNYLVLGYGTGYKVYLIFTYATLMLGIGGVIVWFGRPEEARVVPLQEPSVSMEMSSVEGSRISESVLV